MTQNQSITINLPVDNAADAAALITIARIFSFECNYGDGFERDFWAEDVPKSLVHLCEIIEVNTFGNFDLEIGDLHDFHNVEDWDRAIRAIAFLAENVQRLRPDDVDAQGKQ